jgi:hypothetical protein
MDIPNPKLSIEFISLSGEIIHKTSDLLDIKRLYYSWIYKFNIRIIHTYVSSDLEELDIFYSDTKFIFNDISFNNFPDLIYHILTKSTVDSNNIVTVVKSSKTIYEFKNLDEDDILKFGIRMYLERL